MLTKAVRLCQATFGVLWLAEGDRFRSVALHNLPPAFAAARQREPVVYFGPKSGTGRLIEKKQIFQIDDLTKDPGYIERDPRIVPLVELGGARTALFAPLLKENHVIGSLVLYRQEVRPFTDKQIELVKNFAAQAVIAIENARLLNELRQRTTDLTEALEQQTATADVLQVISSSPGDLEAVFANMLEKAVSICSATFGELYRWNGETFQFQLASMHNTPPQFVEERQSAQPIRPNTNTITGRLVATKSTAQIVDLAADPSYIDRICCSR
jgi:transcriptional regulator with GAF, ATPase, and Fis domain